MLVLHHLFWYLPILSLSSAWGGGYGHHGLPQVDLGYEIHQALSYNVRPDRGNVKQVDGLTQLGNWSDIHLQQHPICSVASGRPSVCGTGDTEGQKHSDPEW
jgi:hypothetical protein